MEREHELSEFLWGGVGRECEFYELGEFYEFFKLSWGLRILGEWERMVRRECEFGELSEFYEFI